MYFFRGNIMIPPRLFFIALLCTHVGSINRLEMAHATQQISTLGYTHGRDHAKTGAAMQCAGGGRFSKRDNLLGAGEEECHRRGSAAEHGEHVSVSLLRLRGGRG
jgi:hypothetical protein